MEAQPQADPHRVALKRQIRRVFMLGIPSVVFGAVATVGALWLGLDLTGRAILAAGIIIALLGPFLIVGGLYRAAVFFERCPRAHPCARRPPNGTCERVACR